MKLAHYLFLAILYLVGSFDIVHAQESQDTKVSIIDPTQQSDSDAIERFTSEFKYYYQIRNDDTSQLDDIYIITSPFISNSNGERAAIHLLSEKEVEAGMTKKRAATDSSKTASVPDVRKNSLKAKYGPFSLKAKERMGIQLNAELLEPGTYFGELSIWTDGKEKVHGLKVILKSDSSKAFTLSDPATSRNTNGILLSNSKLNFSVENDSKFTQYIQLPTVKNMVKVIAEDENIDPKFSSIIFKGEDDKALTEEGFTLAPGQSKRIKMEVDGLKASGKYTGTLRLSSKFGATVKQTTFTLLVKHSWFLASLMILLGVVASTYLKNYLSKIRPKLEVNRGIGKVDKSLKELTTKFGGEEADGKSRKILAFMNTQMGTAKEAAESSQNTEVQSILNVLRRKIAIFPEWKEGVALAANEHIESIVPAATTSSLDAVEKILLKDKPAKLDFDNAEISLNEVETSLNKLISQLPYHNRLEKVEQAFKDAMKVEGIDTTKVESLEVSNMTSIKAAIESMDLQAAAKKMSETERELAALVLAPMSSKIEDRIREYKSNLSKGIRPDGKKAAKEDQETMSTTLAELGKELKKARQTIVSGSSSDAEEMMEDIMGKLDKMEGKANALESTRSISMSREAMVLGNLDAPKAMEAGLEKLILKPGNYDLESIDRRIRNNDIIVSVIISTVALIFGLSLLWANDQTWGSGMDYMTALLWGLGLHQVGSGGVFGGLGSIQNQLVGGGAQNNISGDNPEDSEEVVEEE